ncbi:MAG: DUF4315 family protein [Oscillospiraceae bacterium]|nr:DUF4315 family protein [Oscillospiraceae bacterium]
MNPKIERVNREIDKTKDKIAAQQARLRDLEKQKTHLENEEIVALFRREKLSEDEFSALVRGHRVDESKSEAPVAREQSETEDTGDEEE